MQTNQQQGLYRPEFERDNCGFGLIAQMDDQASHWLVKTSIAALARLTHRGAVAADGKSGDGCGLLMKKPDGFLRIVDRTKDMIVTGGFNVFPREVEDVVAEHPAVAQVGVIGTPHEKFGEAVTAIVVLRADAPTDDESIARMTEEIQQMVKDRKGSVQAPKQVIVAESLPLTGLGKPDKKALRAQFWTGDRAVG